MEPYQFSARRVLSLPKIERNRRTGAGAVDAMAEALISLRITSWLLSRYSTGSDYRIRNYCDGENDYDPPPAAAATAAAAAAAAATLK